MRAPLLLLLLAGAAAPARAQMTGWEGCYDLEIGPWDDPRMGDGGLIFGAPPRVRLDSLPDEERRNLPGARDLLPAPGSPPTPHEFTYWRPLGSDSVELYWSTGFAGLTARLGRADGALRGRAWTHVDVLPSTPARAPVVARPIACDAPMPPEHASWPRYPTEVVLVTGDTLGPGRPLPAGLEPRPHRSGSHWVMHGATAPFSGSDRVMINVRENRIVGNLVVVFDPPNDRAAILARLESALGPPAYRVDHGFGESVVWTGREGNHVFLDGPLVDEPAGQVTVTLTPAR